MQLCRKTAMTTEYGTMDMMSFADVVKMAMEERYGEGYSVDITTVTKNNDSKYVALVIYLMI